MLAPGTVIGGDYRIVRKLEEGGMGAVFVADQISTGAQRALKIIRPELLDAPKLRQRFEQEARITARIASDHVVSIIASGFDENEKVPWLAMELLTGRTLLDAMAAEGPIEPGMMLAILKQLAHAIDAAHAAGVVHRDLKPDNIFLAEARRSGAPLFVKVLDFGIARIVQEAHVARTDALGTPLWMAPEQAGSGDPVGTWTDIWAFGLIVFYLLTGRSFWLSATGEATTLGLVKEICVNPIPSASERARALGVEGTLPSGFDAWLGRCVVRDVKARFTSASAAVAELETVFGSSATLPASPRDVGTSQNISEKASTTPALPEAATELALPEERKPSTPLASATPGVPPPAVSITNAKPAPRPSKLRFVLAAAGLAAIVGAAVGARTLQIRGFSRDCDDGVVTACHDACEHGNSNACVREALHTIDSRDASEASRAADTLVRFCTRGNGAACSALGRARAFPVGAGLKRDAAEAVGLLEKACAKGQSCALLGSLKELGWQGISETSEHYFEAACKAPPTGRESVLDCGFAIAHEHEHAGHVPSKHLASTAEALHPAVHCASNGGDVCGLAWIDAREPAKEVAAAYAKGCEDGSALSCNNLGAMRAEGAGGLEANPAAAKDVFERACAAGEPAACNNLGFIHGGFAATARRGPRGATAYKLRCSGALQVGCAGWGAPIAPVPPGTPANLPEAVAAFERACSAGLTIACVNLGGLVYLGRGVARDRARAEKLFADACFRGDASACGEQGAALLTLRMDHPRDVKAGFGFLERACKGGEKDACLALYGHMADGLPDHRHDAEGIAGLQRLAGEKLYSHTLIQLLESGAEGLAADPARARKMSVEQCDAEKRCSDAAYYLSRGIGGPREEGRALELLERGCDHEDFPSCAELGARYREGRTVARDPTRAVDLFRRACDGADPYACNELSRAYENGEGTARDLGKALALARDSCEAGGPGGCATYGVMLAEGSGVKKDVAAAVPYLAFGCRRAVASACAKLEQLHQPIPELDL